MSKKIIAVIGATGAQGGGLVNAILARGGSEWGVRAVTRDPNSEKARALANRGVEVVGGDADDPGSLDRAFAGAYGAFCVTAFWEHFSPEKELTQAGNMANAAARAGVRHALWSTLEDTRVLVPLSDDRMPTLQGKYKVPHFDAKGEANALFAKAGVPTTLFHTSFYWDNLIHFGMGPKPGPDGKLAFTLPTADEKLPGIAAEDIGKCAFGVFARGEEFAGKSIGIAGEHLSGGEMAEALSRALERPVAYNYVPPEVYRTFGFPGADDLANMFQYKRDFAPQFRGLRSVEFSRSLNPELQSFARWLAANKARIPLS
jgi:uncharacterized protein YbjT (DUF2867 family)